jgi:hypothetical protein
MTPDQLWSGLNTMNNTERARLLTSFIELTERHGDTLKFWEIVST